MSDQSEEKALQEAHIHQGRADAAEEGVSTVLDCTAGGLPPGEPSPAPGIPPTPKCNSFAPSDLMRS
jgi:hypothetical protein